MPTPGENESQSDFVSRCIPIVLDDGTAEDQDQAVAVCGQIWRDRDKQMNAHATLVNAIKSRGDDRAAINTADWYVRKAIDECGEGLFNKTFGTSSDQLLSKAAQQLVFSHPDSTTYKQSTSAAEFKELLPNDAEIPKHTALLDFHTLTTPQEDRDKDVLKTEGAEVDPELPILWQHLQTVPIGKMVAIIEHSKKALKMVSALLDINEFTADVIKLVEAKVLRWSHGFRAIEWEERKANDPSKGFKVTIFEIMEGSKVSVPSNTEARTELFTMLGRGKLASDYWKAVGKHYYDERPAQMAVPARTQMTLKLGDAELAITTCEPSENKDELLVTKTTKTVIHKDDVVTFTGDTGKPVLANREQQEAHDKAATSGFLSVGEIRETVKSDEPGKVKEEATDVTEKALAGTTGDANGHSHTVNLDDDGNGKTGNADGHSHAVEEFSVQEEDGHTHSLSKGDLEEREADVEEKSGPEQEEVKDAELAADIKRIGPNDVPIPTAREILKLFRGVTDEWLDTLSHRQIYDALSLDSHLRGVKGGRVISARNLATLKAVHSDLEEMAKMDKMPRAGQAICESCITKLGGVIKAADKPTEDDDGKPKPDEEKPKTAPVIAHVNVSGFVDVEMTPKEAAAVLLASNDDELLKQVHDTIATLMGTAEQNKKAREYRNSAACQELIGT